MGIDPFYLDIIRALNEKLDPDRFEACAADLLRQDFPTLVPIPGGGDAGMDGAVGDMKGHAYPLVATTGADVARNLRSSLRSYKRNRGKRRKAVSATSRKLSPQQRRNLEEIANAEGFTLIQVYEQTAIANLLWHSPRWCRDLLGLTGDPPSLSLLPSTNRPLLDYELIGRDADLEYCRGTPGDVLIVGQPGSGKTYLLHQFARQGGGLFVVSSQIGAIANGIRAQKPAALLIDDAHTRLDLVEELRHLRHEMGGEFRIIADCWPGARDECADALSIPPTSIREMELLTRDEIVRVIRAAGIVGPVELIRELVNQSVGRPGLAVTLTRLCLRDEVRDVALGTALTRDVRITFERLVGPEAIDVLASFALGGDSGMPMRVVAEALDSSPSTIRNVVTRLAAGGVLVERGEVLAVVPTALRHALVRDTFFRGATSLPWQELASKAPDQDNLLQTLIGAKACGGSIADSEITSRLRAGASSRAWADFASLGEQQVRWVLTEQPTPLDDVVFAALHYVPRAVIPRLLKDAVGDDRALHSHPTQPLRILRDWVRAGLPRTNEPLRRRTEAITSALQWLREGRNPGVALEAIQFAMSPEHERQDAGPGSGMVVTLTHSFVTQKDVQGFHALWRMVVAVLPGLKIENWNALFLAVRALVYPHAMNAKLPNAHRREMRSVAKRMVRDVAKIGKDRPGVAAWAMNMSRILRLNLKLHVPKDYLALSPVRERADWRKEREKQGIAARRLALEWARENPSKVATRIIYLEMEARAVGVAVPEWTHFVCSEIARVAERPLQWAAEFMKHQVRCELVGPFSHEASKSSDGSYTTFINACLESAHYRPIAIRAVLRMLDPSEELWATVQAHLPTCGQLVHLACLRGEVSQVALSKLLQHPSPRVAVSAATGIHYARKNSGFVLSEDSAQLWRTAICKVDPEHAHIYGVFDKDPDLAFDWLAALLKSGVPDLWERDHEIKEATSALTHEHRIRVIDLLTGDHVSSEFVTRLVDNDLAAYKCLLSRSNLRRFHLEPLESRPSEDWLHRATAALDSGHAEEEIAKAVFFESLSWSGSEVTTCEGWIENFKPLLLHADDRIKEIARLFIEHSERRLVAARQRERHEAVYGM